MAIAYYITVWDQSLFLASLLKVLSERRFSRLPRCVLYYPLINFQSYQHCHLSFVWSWWEKLGFSSPVLRNILRLMWNKNWKDDRGDLQYLDWVPWNRRSIMAVAQDPAATATGLAIKPEYRRAPRILKLLHLTSWSTSSFLGNNIWKRTDCERTVAELI